MHYFHCTSPATSGHTGAGPRGWPTPKAALGGVDPSGCFKAVFWQAAGTAQRCIGRQHLLRSYLFHKLLDLPLREMEAYCPSCGALCSALGATRTWGRAEQPQQWLTSVRTAAKMWVAFQGPQVLSKNSLTSRSDLCCQ